MIEECRDDAGGKLLAFRFNQGVDALKPLYGIGALGNKEGNEEVDVPPGCFGLLGAPRLVAIGG